MKQRVFVCVCLLYVMAGFGQGLKKTVTLEEVICLAREQSLDALVARDKWRASYWQFRNFRADLLPNVVLEGMLPSFDRSLSSYQKEDGTYTFVSSNSIGGNLFLAVRQNIPWTGGKIVLQSKLERIDQLDGEQSTSYMSVPFSILLEQPLMAVNRLKWNRKIEPERYRQAKQQFAVDMEDVAIQAVMYYFGLLLEEVNVELDSQNLVNAISLVEIAERKRNMGILSENDLLQLRLNKLNASSSLIQSKQAREQQMFALRNYLGFNEELELELVVPSECPRVVVDFVQVLEVANRNNPFRYEVVCSLLEAARQVAEAKANRGFRVDVNASIGFTGSDRTLLRTYRDLRNRESVSVWISIPILNWGKGRGYLEVARSQEEVVKMQVKKSEQDFEQGVLTVVRQFQEQVRLNEIVRLADTISRRRYKTAYEMFVLGKISVLDLNAAQTERDDAKRAYINQLYLSWKYYYTLRKLALFDFVTGKNIEYK